MDTIIARKVLEVDFTERFMAISAAASDKKGFEG
jgi:hypothetical protein